MGGGIPSQVADGGCLIRGAGVKCSEMGWGDKANPFVSCALKNDAMLSGKVEMASAQRACHYDEAWKVFGLPIS